MKSSVNESDYFAEADKEMISRLREISEFLLPLNKKWSERFGHAAASAERELGLGNREHVLDELRRLIYEPDQLDSIYISHILKRERFDLMKKGLRQVFPKTWLSE